MIDAALVLRPEPGNAHTAVALAARGIAVRRCPLFRVVAVDWIAPDPAAYDALLLTSANAVRHAGPDLARLRTLPTLAVGEATAAAATARGLSVAITGNSDAPALVASARRRGWTRLLHLAGRDRRTLAHVDQRTVYASEPVALAPAVARQWIGHVALLHSARAADEFAAAVTRDRVDRAGIAVAAISPAVAEAAGPSWAATVIAALPTDAALVDAAAALIDPPGAATDKHGR